MSIKEILRDDLSTVMYEDFGEEFVHVKGHKRRVFLGMVDVEKEADEVMDSNFAQTKIRVMGKLGDFQTGDFIEQVEDKRRYKVNKIEAVNAEELEIYVV